MWGINPLWNLYHPFPHKKSPRNTHLQLSSESRHPRWTRNLLLKLLCGENHGFAFPLLMVWGLTRWCLELLFWVIWELWSAATVDARLCSKVAGNAVKIWRWFWKGGGVCSPHGGRSSPHPPRLCRGGWGKFRSQFCGWQVARVHSCITAPKKKSAEEIRTLMETFVKKFPLCDCSGPVGWIQSGAGSMHTQHQQHYQSWSCFLLSSLKQKLRRDKN